MFVYNSRALKVYLPLRVNVLFHVFPITHLGKACTKVLKKFCLLGKGIGYGYAISPGVAVQFRTAIPIAGLEVISFGWTSNSLRADAIDWPPMEPWVPPAFLSRVLLSKNCRDSFAQWSAPWFTGFPFKEDCGLATSPINDQFLELDHSV